jgi:hypothetical protein
MRLHYLLASALLLMVSCQEKDKAPVAPDKMQKIITDLHFAEVYSSMVDDTLHIARNKNKDSLAVYYRDILAHHKITEQEFMTGLEWYKIHPDELDSIYSRILPQMNALEATIP